MKQKKTSDRLKQLMQERNLRQVDILKLSEPFCQQYNVKLDKSSISQYISGRNEPSQDKLILLAMALGVSEAWLMGYDVPMQRQLSTNDISDDPNFIRYETGKTAKIPLVGVIRCGEPIFAETNIEDYIDTNCDDLLSGETYFWLRADGDSMRNVGIFPNDLLLIRKQSDVNSGDIAAVCVNGETATLKRIIKKDGALILQPENNAYETKIFIGKEMNQIHIMGRLMKVERHF